MSNCQLTMNGSPWTMFFSVANNHQEFEINLRFLTNCLLYLEQDKNVDIVFWNANNDVKWTDMVMRSLYWLKLRSSVYIVTYRIAMSFLIILNDLQGHFTYFEFKCNISYSWHCHRYKRQLRRLSTVVQRSISLIWEDFYRRCRRVILSDNRAFYFLLFLISIPICYVNSYSK